MRSRHRIVAPSAQAVPADLPFITVSLILDYRCCGSKIQHRGWKLQGGFLMAARTVSRRLSRDVLALGSLVAWAICAQAQEKPREPTKPDEKLQEVVITGSRMCGPAAPSLGPD